MTVKLGFAENEIFSTADIEMKIIDWWIFIFTVKK